MQDDLSSLMEVRYNPSTAQHQLHAVRPFSKGDVLCLFGAREELTTPNYLTLQIGTDRHILLEPVIIQYANHSCDPNVFFDTTTMEFRALEDIAAGDELTFFYPSTEWEMAQPFQCHCGSSKCLGLIQGAAGLPDEILEQYRLTDFILAKLALRQSLLTTPVTPLG